MSYIGQPLNKTDVVGPVSKTKLVATASQTVFSGFTYQIGFLEVYQNGVYLLPEDYTANNGVSVTLAVGATAGDELMFVAGFPPQTVPVFSGGDVSNNIGYLNMPQNTQSANYTFVSADSGKHVFHPSADTSARTFTIPANSAVAYPIGTVLTVINQNSAGVVTIAINSDVMRLAGAGTLGSRTLAANGMASMVKITATEWIISGSGLT